MSERTGIFAGDNPFEITRRWLSEAEQTEVNDPNAIALATVDAQGMPNARMVLLKDIEEGAFVFYTNYGSAKSQEIEASGTAAFVMHWKSLRRQVRVRGHVSREDGPQADDYYRSRSLKSRARRLGLGTVAAAQLARGADGRGRPGHRAEGQQPRAAAVLGRLADHPGRDRILGGRGVSPA